MLALLAVSACGAQAGAFQVREVGERIDFAATYYHLEITKRDFRYGFTRPDGTVIAPPNAEFGLEFGGGKSVDARLLSSGRDTVVLEVTNDKGGRATVTIEPGEHYVRFSVTQSQTNRILARLGGLSPAFGLADHAAFGRTNTDVTGYSDGHFRAQEPPGHKRLVSNFVISPRRGIAMVNMEKGMKLVRVRADDAAQGVAAATQMPALYYFIGTPTEIYAAYLDARNREGYRIFKPKYEFFGVGWEAFGALGWNTNEKTVTENVERYLSLGYPLEWMVVGSGFWPNEDPAMRSTTSFGLWDQARYPDPRRFIGHFKNRGLKFFLGLRIAFITNGPYASEGLRGGYFIRGSSAAHDANERIESHTAVSPLTPALSPLKGEGVAKGARSDSSATDRMHAHSPSRDQTAANAEKRAEQRMDAVRAPSPLNGERAGVRGENLPQPSATPTAQPAAQVFNIAFPKSPCYLLDGSNPDAVKWYVSLCQKWLDFGVDGFKEDLFGYKTANMREGNIDAVNGALMDKGVFIMGRNGYLGSACDIHRIEDFNFDQNQDRGPINCLAFAYSGFPYAYPDITGGTFGEGRRMPPLNSTRMQTYMMRVAQFDAVNPAMAVGMGPWNFGSAQVEKVMLEAAQLHARLHPYIYSAAIDAYETGFPWTMTPLPIAFPDDPQVYERENTSVRGYQWMLGPSLLACPLYGDDYATATTRDVYLPAGTWIDYDTGEVHSGPKLLKGFPLPVGKTPLFVGGQGVLVLRDLPGQKLQAVVYPIGARGSSYRFTHRDGATRTTITKENNGWDAGSLTVTDSTASKAVSFERDARSGAIRFPIVPSHDYRITGGQSSIKQ